jgi:hypothetical protein
MLDGRKRANENERDERKTFPESGLRTQNICSEEIKGNMRKHTPVFEVLHI